MLDGNGGGEVGKPVNSRLFNNRFLLWWTGNYVQLFRLRRNSEGSRPFLLLLRRSLRFG
jgi:hypothetical protein